MQSPETRSVRAAAVLAAAAAATAAGLGLFACNTVLGIDDLDLGECQTAAVQCLTPAQPQTCDAEHHWQNATACTEQTCVKGACQGSCLSGTRQCDGKTLQQCNEDGQGFTADDKPCQFVCLKGQCAGECEPGSLSCSGNVLPRLCSAEGEWDDQAKCVEQTCKEGACIGECEQDAKRCSGLTPQLCDGNGAWQPNGSPCVGDGVTCQAGDCVKACSPGDRQCVGNAPQLCDDTGVWQNDGDKCKECNGCDLVTGMCREVPIKEGEVCDDDNACTLVSRCTQSGDCVPEPKEVVGCVGENTCSSGACDPVTGSCAAPDGTTKCDDGNVCTAQSSCAGGSCKPDGDHTFAHWFLKPPLPDPRFEKVEYESPEHEKYEVVFDRVTRLLWERTLLEEGEDLVTWEQAAARCKALSLPGYPSGWRLPARIELVSLLDYSKEDPSINEEFFPWYGSSVSAERKTFWSSSPLVLASPPISPKAWVVDFRDGYVYPQETGSHLNVRCVH
jgi:hypothetical protein